MSHTTERCATCGHQAVAISMHVDGTDLVMRSCDNCDTRTWALGGAPIELDTALDEVGLRAGRRR